MQNNVGVWIDLSKAIVVTVSGDKTKIKNIDGVDSREREPGQGKNFVRFGDQFSNLEKQKEGRLANRIKIFLKSVEENLSHSDALVIFGPANMKKELANLILKNKSLVHKLKGVKSADSMTDNQTVAWVIDYFKKNKK